MIHSAQQLTHKGVFQTPFMAIRGLRREEAARYIGVSASKFDALVRDGRMPSPIKIDGCSVWDIHKLNRAFEDLIADEDSANPWDV